MLREFIHDRPMQIYPKGPTRRNLVETGSLEIKYSFYRLNPNTNWTRIEGPLQPHSIQSYDINPEDMNDPHGSPVKLLYNEDISLSISRRRESAPFRIRLWCDVLRGWGLHPRS